MIEVRKDSDKIKYFQVSSRIVQYFVVLCFIVWCGVVWCSKVL